MKKQKVAPKSIPVEAASAVAVYPSPPYMYFCEIQIPNPKQPDQVSGFISVWTTPPTFDEVYNYIDNNPRTDWSQMDKEQMLTHLRTMYGIFGFPRLPVEFSSTGQLMHTVCVSWDAAVTDTDHPKAIMSTFGRVTVRRMFVQDNKKESHE